MTSRELWWLAGLLEGEGHFGYAYIGSSRKRPQGFLHLRIRLSMCDEDIVRRCAGLANCGHVTGPKNRGGQPIWSWAVQAKGDAATLMQKLKPLMGIRRQEQIEACMAELRKDEAVPQARRTHCPQGHRYAGDNLYLWRGHRHCRKCRAAAQRRQRI